LVATERREDVKKFLKWTLRAGQDCRLGRSFYGNSLFVRNHRNQIEAQIDVSNPSMWCQGPDIVLPSCNDCPEKVKSWSIVQDKSDHAGQKVYGGSHHGEMIIV
jgi:hypothetical protein